MKIHYRFSSYIDFLNWVNKYNVQFDEIYTIEVCMEDVNKYEH